MESAATTFDGTPALLPNGRVERALALTAPDESHRIRKKAPGAVLVGFALARRVLDLLHYEVLIRLRADPEDIHRARSTVRRLRAVLRGFRLFLDRAWADTLREELRWLADELASVRDIDVTLMALRSRAAAIQIDEAPYLQDVLTPLGAARQTARARLLETLDGARYKALMEALETAARAPKFGVVPEPPSIEIATSSLCNAAKRVRKAVRGATESSTPSELHHARIVARNGRYVAEACAYVWRKPASRLVKRLACLQDSLGAIGDARLVQERLRELAVHDRANLVVGELLALEAVDDQKARRKWSSMRRKALRRRWFSV